ncbi:hypothetical protein FS749_006288 [Ceratobasidium sp. UAMH 11750]|nr:hypothetical protein FS749_006288 [Ceratobasidium sp. UAMH 11750]
MSATPGARRVPRVLLNYKGSGLNNHKVSGKRKVQDQELEASDGDSELNVFATSEQNTRPMKRQPTMEGRELRSTSSTQQHEQPATKAEAKGEGSVIVLDDSESEYSESEVEEVKKTKSSSAGKGGDQKQKKNALNRAVRDAFYALGGWKTGQDVLPSQKDKNNQPRFWTTDKHGRKIITPAWHLDFDRNWKEWGSTFLENFHLKASDSAYADYLATVGDKKVRLRLKQGTWNACKVIGRSKNKRARGGDSVDIDESQGRKNLLLARATARVGTCVESQEFDSLFTLSAQSPQVSDTEDDGHVTRLEPRWLSSKVAEIKGALDQKSKLGDTQEFDISYIKQDVPMKQPGGGMRYPYWAIDKNWMQDYPAEFEKSKFMIDMSATTEPDTSSLARDYGIIPRNYVEGPLALVQEGPDGSNLPVPAGPSVFASASDKNSPAPQTQMFFLVPASMPVQPSGSASQPMHTNSQVLMPVQAISVAGTQFLVPATSQMAYRSVLGSHQLVQPGGPIHIAQPYVQSDAQSTSATEASAPSTPIASSSRHQQ